MLEPQKLTFTDHTSLSDFTYVAAHKLLSLKFNKDNIYTKVGCKNNHLVMGG